ncbi:MAG TPA: haloacid dehalogenase type II [Candidatus Obscuribacterales bacterium]
MPLTRRQFLGGLGSGIALGLGSSSVRSSQAAVDGQHIKAMAFDAFPVFDPRPIFAKAEALFPGLGDRLSNEWRTRQFEYTWLRSLSHQYADFWHVTEDALVYAAHKLKLDLDSAKRAELMNGYLQLKPWPDVQQALNTIKSSGIRLAFLSNFTEDMLRSNIKSSSLDGIFDHILSTDGAKTYKPDPKAYQLGVDALHADRDQIVFVAFAGWDAAGAAAFGYPTFWVNRLNSPLEELPSKPDGMGKDLNDLLSFIKDGDHR